jgi:hypothetical protein
MEISIKNINNFIITFCTEVYEMPFADLELKMDDHTCIVWAGKEYFVPENAGNGEWE